jgi:hypothetical protein
MIGVEQASFRRAQAFFRELQDFPDDASARREGADFVADAERVARARGLAVDSHVVRFARGLSERPRLEQARSKQEAIEPHRLAQRLTGSASLNGNFT